jgi:hypothetical protein
MAYTTINKSTDYFNTKLYTGTTNAQSITGVGFQPDMTWIKVRSASAYHVIQDAVRGATGTDTYSLITNAEAGDNTDAITSFDSDGFSLGTDANDRSNYSGQTHVAWNWKANGQGSSNTAGSINTTYTSVNTTAGFSISKYTGNGTGGATIGHGLGSVPHMYIVKRLDAGSSNWHVYHQGIGATKGIRLNLTNAENTTDIWQDTAPTSSVFSLGSSVDVNASGGTYIAYCFAEKTGYSKFGSYTGNGNADGTFVYTGFKPNWVMIKETSGVGGWRIFDNKRPGYNEPYALLADNSDAETETGASRNKIDQLSNGFKLRFQYNDTNGAGGSYIYMAFGQSLVGSNNIPCTAR